MSNRLDYYKTYRKARAHNEIAFRSYVRRTKPIVTLAENKVACRINPWVSLPRIKFLDDTYQLQTTGKLWPQGFKTEKW